MYKRVWFNNKNDSYENSDDYSLIWLLYMHRDSAYMGRSTPTTAFDGVFDTLPSQCRHIEHMHEGV